MAIVYTHRKKTSGEIFYIGMSVGIKGIRMYQNSGRNQHWHNVNNKHGRVSEVIYEGSAEECVELEEFLISEIGLENLTNKSTGGVLPTIPKEGRVSPNSKHIWLNTETGIFYDTLASAHKSLGNTMKHRTFRAQLDGQCPNRTSFIRLRKEGVDLSQ